MWSSSLDVTRSAGVTEHVEFEEIRLPEHPWLVDGLVIPAEVLDRMEAMRRRPSIRPRPPRFGVLDDRFRVETGAGAVLATDVSAVAAHLAGRGAAAPSSTSPIGSWR